MFLGSSQANQDNSEYLWNSSQVSQPNNQDVQQIRLELDMHAPDVGNCHLFHEGLRGLFPQFHSDKKIQEQAEVLNVPRLQRQGLGRDRWRLVQSGGPSEAQRAMQAEKH